MNLQKDIDLKEFNTFGIKANAALFASFETVESLKQILKDDLIKSKGLKILGGGSNILITKDVQEVILKNDLKGIELLDEDDEHYYVKVASGEGWHDFVIWCVEHNYQGLENLSLIPGTVGAAPMQNIGAYGAEVKDTITFVHTIRIDDGSYHIFTNEACRFGYRESIFKQDAKDKFVITAVEFKLNKIPNFKISYGAIQEILDSNKDKTISAKTISDAVIKIRESKLPNPKVIGNSGSFFKNPEIPIEQYEFLLEKFPSMPSYPINETTVKVPAGWLIEQCQWKGFREKDFGVHALQALVLVNYGSANGNEIYNLSTQILESVKNKFDIALSREVNIW
jgi:UDP-N-acetylmuramate dehydrogenase